MIGLLVGAILAGIAWRLSWLTRGGAVAACLVVAVVLHFGGIRWAAALLVFAGSGSLLTVVGRRRKTQPEHRGRGRTGAQVIGTGGIAAVVSVWWGTSIGPEWLRPLLPAAFLGAVAAAAADTWATEVGMLSPHLPRLITTGQPVPAGTSGGVSRRGSGAGVAGAVAIAFVGAAGDLRTIVAVIAAGVFAMFLDSLVGATVQASFQRPNGSFSEEPSDRATPVRGVAWITNPVVNIFATLAGAIMAAAIAYAWR